MADKTQNIFINYKFPMAEAEKASQILNRVNNSQNLVQQGAQKTGQTLSTAYNSAGKSIESMSIQLARLKTQIQVSSDPKRVADLSNQYKVLKQQIDAANKSAFETPKALKATAAATQGVAQQFGQFYQAAKLVLTAGIAKEILDISLGMATLEGNVAGVERAFQRAFPNSSALLRNLREATHGTVTDFELMQRTLQATNLGVNVERLPKLFEFAAARAQQTGESVDYLVDSIVRGIGRKSLLVLDNLGISATRLKEKLDGAALASQSVGKATEVVGEIAEEELTKMGGYLETNATKVKQLNVAWENLRLTLAKKTTSGFLIDLLTAGTESLEAGIKVATTGPVQAATDFHLQIVKDAASAKAALVAEGKAYRDLGDDIGAKIEFMKKELAETKRLADVRKTEIQETEASIESTKKDLYQESLLGLQTGKSIRATEKATTALKERVDQQVRSREVLLATIPIFEEYIKHLETQRELEQPVQGTGIIERKKKEIEALQDQIEKTNDLADLGPGGKLTKALEIAQAELGDLQRAFFEFDPIKFEISIDKATESLNKFIKVGEKVNNDAMFKRFEEGIAELANQIPEKLPDIAVPTGWEIFLEDMAVAWNEFRTEVAVTGVDILADQLMAAEQLELQSLQGRLKALKNFYDEQQILAGDNHRAKEQLRLREERDTTNLQRQIFEKEKKTRKSQALIDGAAGVIKAFATYPYPAALIISALIAAQTVSQIRIIDRQRPGFKKGVIDLQGPGTSTSDSIPANLSKHESVMTAWETQHAGDVLRDVRAKKLDNKVLKELKQGRGAVQQNFNDERIIKAIEKNRPPDVIEQSGIVYKATKKSDTYLQKIRAKSVRL